MNASKIILAGGSGFLGRSLAPALASKGYEVVILSRGESKTEGAIRTIHWDGKTLGAWAVEFEGAKAVVNLVGKNVNCRYTPANLAEINESRVHSVRATVKAINACQRPPEVWVQAASLAIFGDSGDRLCDERSVPGIGIPVDTCLMWERAWSEGHTPRTRKVLLRMSFVLGEGGGVLRMLVNLARFCLGGAVGSGRQGISWIHVEDMNRLWIEAIENPAMSGVYNATSPHPVSNREFMGTLRSTLHRPWCPSTPAFLVPFGCWLLRTEPVLALTGRMGVPARLLKEGFEFKYPDVGDALRQVLRSRKEIGLTIAAPELEPNARSE